MTMKLDKESYVLHLRLDKKDEEKLRAHVATKDTTLSKFVRGLIMKVLYPKK